MATIEELVEGFGRLPPAAADRWSVYEAHPKRLYLTRDALGRHSMFIVGERSTFGRVPRFSGVTYSDTVTVVPSGETLAALRFTTGSLSAGNRVMAHIAYELVRLLDAKPEATNAQLLDEVRWVLELLGGRDVALTDEMQRGLVGELVFLRKLLQHARRLEVPASTALDAWHGYDRSKRDFAGPRVAVEVKFTSAASRQHHVHGLAQLEAQGDEDVFVFSVGAKMDPSAPRKLPDFVADVMSLLIDAAGTPDPDLRLRFVEQLERYGYVSEMEQVYRGGSGFMNFHLPPRLFSEKTLDRLRLGSFKNDELPSMVLDVSYVLEIKAAELDDSAESSVLSKLLHQEVA